MLTRIDTVQMFLFLFAIFLSEKNKNKEILLLCHIAKTKKDPTKPWKKFFQDAKLFFCGKAPIVSLLTISSTFNPLFKVLFIFPHGTCSLSVSRLYLALDEIYHPFRAAISNNPTLRKKWLPGKRRSRWKEEEKESKKKRETLLFFFSFPSLHFPTRSPWEGPNTSCTEKKVATSHVTGLSPSMMPSSKKTCTRRNAMWHGSDFAKLQFGDATKLSQILNLSSSHFTRRYYGNPS